MYYSNKSIPLYVQTASRVSGEGEDGDQDESLVRSRPAMEWNSDQDFVLPREVKRKRQKVTVKLTEESGAGLSSDSDCDAHVKVVLHVYLM